MLGAGGVLVVRDPTGVHILPGGRRQAGETLEQTVRREVGGYELGAELQPTAVVQRLPLLPSERVS